VLEAAKQIENPNKFLSDYNQQRKQRRKGPKGPKQEVERRVQRSAESNDDFPSLTTLQSSSMETTTCNSYAAVLRKGLLKDQN
jgi:hypothetical protein